MLRVIFFFIEGFSFVTNPAFFFFDHGSMSSVFKSGYFSIHFRQMLVN